MVKILRAATNIVIFVLFIYTWNVTKSNLSDFNKSYIYLYLVLSLCSFLTDKFLYTGQKNENKKENQITSIVLYLVWFTSLIVPVLEYVFLTRKNYIITLIGVLLVVIGIVVRGIAIKTLGEYFSSDVETWDNHSIVKVGIYKYIRHPAYSGNILQVIGFPLVLNSYLSLILSAITIIVFIWRIHVEEKFLVKHHPEYKKYVAETKRILPKIW